MIWSIVIGSWEYKQNLPLARAVEIAKEIENQVLYVKIERMYTVEEVTGS